MWQNPQFSVDLVTFTEEIFSWKVHFLHSVMLDGKNYYLQYNNRKTHIIN